MEFRLAIPTAAGCFTAGGSVRGLRWLCFPGDPAGEAAPAGDPPSAAAGWRRQLRQALADRLLGRETSPLPPLDLTSGTTFQQQVWAALRQIPPGQVCTYGELAVRLGKPGAARAVGRACGANPLPVLIPCHRVLAAGGGLGGFSGGLDWKRRLLAAEGVAWRG